MTRPAICLLATFLLVSGVCRAAAKGPGGGGGGGGDHGGFGGYGGGNDCERGGVECQTGITSTDLGDCKKVLTKLAIATTGTTVFCPVNPSMRALAWRYGFLTVDDLIAGIDANAAAKAELITGMQMGVVSPATIYTKAQLLAATASSSLVLNTLNTVNNPSAKLTVDRKGGGHGKIRLEVQGPDARNQGILAFDFDFAGPYSNTTSTLIVHAVQFPLFKPNGTNSGHGGGRPGGDDGPYDGPRPGKPVTTSDLANCQSLLDAVGIVYTGATVFCPTNRGVDAIARGVKLPNTAALVNEIKNGNSSLFLPWVTKVLKFHIVNGIFTRDLLPLSNGTAVNNLTTLLTADDPNAVISLRKARGRGKNGKLQVAVINPFQPRRETSRVLEFNFTWTGAYVDGVNTFIVHAIDKPLLLPPNTYSDLGKVFTALKATKISARMFRPLLKKALKATGAATMFLPLDSAWQALGTSSPSLSWAPNFYMDAINKNRALKEALAKYHYVDGDLSSSPVASRLQINGVGEPIYIDSATQVHGSLDPQDIAILDSTYTAGHLTVYVLSGLPLLPKNLPA